MAAGNQGARGPLITWTVIATIASVVAIIMAIFFYVDSSHVNDRITTQTDLYAKVLRPEALRGPAIADLEAARQDEAWGMTPSMLLLDVALGQANTLAKLVSGSEDRSSALSTGKAAIGKAEAAGVQLPGEPSLAATVEALVARVEALKTEAESNKTDSQASQEKLRQTLASTEQQIATMNSQLDELRASRDQALQMAQTTSQQQTEQFGTTAEELRKQLASSQETVSLLNTQNAELGAEIERMRIEMTQLRDRLGANRVDVTRLMTRQADGKILRVPTPERVFIDLGASDHVSPGLTFEVYDKLEGIPPAGDPSNDQNLPIGKASIEVVNVLPTGSECVIVRKTYGTAITQGDLIVNLVYDRNTRNKFVVYGNFDIDQNGVATPQDAEIIKRLVTRWGGEVVEQINADTDFVVLGKEPVIPDRPVEDDALARAIWEEAIRASDEYDEMSRRAREYRLPILNQNRFLYLTGYYTQSRR